MTGRIGQVGSELQSKCGKCGEAWHVVIALAENHIAQVQCGECGARHRYRPAGGAAADGASLPSSIAKKSPARSRKSDAKPVVSADTSRPRRDFRPNDTYEVGDRMVHPNFGEGVVQATRGATKVEVLFDAGTKLLVQGHHKG